MATKKAVKKIVEEPKVKAVIEKVVETKVAEELINSETIKLNISVYRGFNKLPEATRVEVVNDGGGDVFASSDMNLPMNKETLLIVGEKKSFDTNEIYVVATSRPTVTINQYK